MAIKYIPFFPEPIEGQALLNNFKRTLRYKGAGEVEGKLRRGMPLYEMEKVETVGENKDGNMLIRGECVSACAYLKEQGIEVDLVYIDPPFASGADYAKKIHIRRNPKVAETIAKAEQELEDDALKAFDEMMYGDVWDKQKYLNWMYENLMAIKSVMSETACIYVHLDWHIGHYVKILLDEIFGEDNFINEIVWHYKTFQGQSHSYFAKKHDTLYLYAKQKMTCVYNELFESENIQDTIDIKRWSTYLNENNQIISANMPIQDSRFVRYLKKWEKENKRQVEPNDVIFEVKGQPIDSVWELKGLDPKADEKVSVGYPTQKPAKLLERLILASSNEGDLVADFFGGSGVTTTVASKLERKFIHCDIGINSLQTTRDRLVGEKAEFDILEIKDGISLYRNPVQTMDKIKSLILGLKNEDSLDAFWKGGISDSKYGLIPVYVPNLLDSSTKVLDEVLMNRIIHEAIPDLNNVKKVIVYYIDVSDMNAIKKFITDDDSTTIEIELRDMKEILDDVVVEDYAEFSIEEVQEAFIKGFKVLINRFMSDRVMSKIDAFNQKAFANVTEKKPYKPIAISDEGLELIEFISLDCTASDGEWHSDSEIKIDKLGYVILNGTKTKEFWDGTIKASNKPLRIKIRNISGDESVYTHVKVI